MNNLFEIKLLIFFIFIGGNIFAQNNKADDIAGTWLTEDGNLQVKISKTGSAYQGLIVWMKEPNENDKPKVDQFNPDKSKRNNTVLGETLILYNMKFDGKNTWEDGIIYDSRNGREYSCKITLEGKNILNVRGFMGISILGQTNAWKRVEGF